MNSIKILGIAPYDELKHSMRTVAQQFNEFSIDLFTANLTEGQELAQKLSTEGEYDIIISRGGTAELIQEVVDIPVIDISISIYDILSSIQMAQSYTENIAIVGYESITKTAHLLCNILKYNIKIITINYPEQALEILSGLKAEGYELILCDAITKQAALELAINTILITSGAESIGTAYRQASVFAKYIRRTKNNQILLEQAISQQSLLILLIDNQFNIITSNLADELTYSLVRLLKKRDLVSETEQFYHSHNGQTYRIIVKQIINNGKNYFHCELKLTTPPIIHQQFGVKFESHSTIIDTIPKRMLFSTFIQEKNLTLMSQLLKQYNAMLIFGEEGTDKTSLAYSCFLKFPQNTNNLITINCKLFEDRLWKYLTSSTNSPFLDEGNTLLFQNCEQLSLTDVRKLVEIIKDSKLLKRQNVIFTYTTQIADPDKRIFKEIVNTLECASLFSPSLSDRYSELSSIITLILNKINIESSTQVIGFSPQAMQLLLQFQWTGNFFQLERVIKKLVLSANAYYISENEVSDALQEERKHLNHLQRGAQANQINIIEEKTLFDYNQDLVRAVLEHNKGNQTKTAKQLGISRTTLWRYLKTD